MYIRGVYTQTMNLTAELKKNTYYLYNSNVFIGAWDNRFDFDEFCAARGFSVQVEVVA